MSSTVEQTKSEIRFALSQLAACNGQHQFETLARMLARATVTRNVLIATGPVSSGGDHGRDFETYRTDLAGQTQPLGQRIGLTDRDTVAFTCTLQQDNIGSKIRGDIAKIMSSGTAVTYALAYCERNIPVARRHDLQRDVRQSHGIHLEIFDGAGIAELLAHHATFWIAEEYLHLPARTLPSPPERPDWYEARLAHWRAAAQPAGSYGDYVDLTTGLRYAYEQHEGRADLPFWLDKLAPLTDQTMPLMLRHVARHQTILAHHIGLGSMRPVDREVAEEIKQAAASDDAILIADATALLALACSAFAHGQTSHTAERIMAWNAALIDRIIAGLASNPSAGDTCSLLESLAVLNLLPDLDHRMADATTNVAAEERLPAIADREFGPLPVPALDPAASLAALARLAETLPEASLYPVQRAARFLTVNMASLMDQPSYERIAGEFDRLLAATAGADAAADQAIDRASTFFAADRFLDALRQMHHARRSLLHGDAGRRLIGTTIATAAAYQRLRLFAAAKYYGLLATNLTKDDTLGQFPHGLYAAALADYRQGNWASAALLTREALIAHTEVAGRILDFDKHPWLGNALSKLITINAFAGTLEPAVKDLLGTVVTDHRIAGMVEGYTEAVTAGGPLWWDGMNAEQFADHLAADLHTAPFADTAAVRRTRFSCLGVDWTVEFANIRADIVVAERFTAALQIALAHLAAADPLLLPTQATVHVTATDPTGLPVIEEHNSAPTETRFRCVLPSIGGTSRHHADSVAEHTLIAVTTVIFMVSALPDDTFNALVGKAFADGLATNTIFAVPYDTAYNNLADEHDLETGLTDRALLPPSVSTAPPTGPGLDMPQGPGPGYTQDKSHAEIAFKYQDLTARVSPTLTALQNDQTFVAAVTTLREQGWRDWHILLAVFNRAKNIRMTLDAPHLTGDLAATIDFFLTPEPHSDPLPGHYFTVDALQQALEICMPASAASMWNLMARNPVNTDALHRLLTDRYGWADDVPHDDPFHPSAQDNAPSRQLGEQQ